MYVHDNFGGCGGGGEGVANTLAALQMMISRGDNGNNLRTNFA